MIIFNDMKNDSVDRELSRLILRGLEGKSRANTWKSKGHRVLAPYIYKAQIPNTGWKEASGPLSDSVVTGAPLGMEVVERIPAARGVCESGPPRPFPSQVPLWETPLVSPALAARLTGSCGRRSGLMGKIPIEKQDSHRKQRLLSKSPRIMWPFLSLCSDSSPRPDRKHFRNSLDFLFNFLLSLSGFLGKHANGARNLSAGKRMVAADLLTL